MKKVLIVGKNSYIGDSFANYVANDDEITVDIVDSFNDKWKEAKFEEYDIVYHVAGIVHKKETSENKELYYKVNRDLVYEIAQKAKDSGVKQFIFLSTMSVYGIEKGVINQITLPSPKTNYGKSKLEAENLINTLNDKDFKVAIIRPPMIYGKNCKGNYVPLRKLALKIPFFPNIDNKRSMLYIDNLSEFIKLIIENRESGLFFPQNSEYVNTSVLVKTISDANESNMHLIKFFNPLIKFLSIFSKFINKIFGDLIYGKSISNYKVNYAIIDFKRSIAITERDNDEV